MKRILIAMIALVLIIQFLIAGCVSEIKLDRKADSPITTIIVEPSE